MISFFGKEMIGICGMDEGVQFGVHVWDFFLYFYLQVDP